MATFETQVEALTGISIDGSSNPTQTELSSFLVDGVKEVVNRMIEVRPAELSKFTNTTNSASYVDKIGKILSVVREHDSTTILRKCTAIDPGDRYEATDSDSLLYRSKTNPGFYELDGAIYTVPTAGSGNNDIIVTQVHYDTGLVYSDTYGASNSSIVSFPSDYEYLVAIYAAIRSLQAALATKSVPSVPVSQPLPVLNITATDPTAISLTTVNYNPVIASTSTVLSSLTAPTYTKPTTALTPVPSLTSVTFTSIDSALDANASVFSTATMGTASTYTGSVPTYTKPTLVLGSAPTISNLNITAVPPDVPTMGSSSVTINGTAPTYTAPSIDASGGELVDLRGDDSQIDFNDWFNIVGDYIETQEDVELAQAQIGKISTYIQAYGQAMQSQLHAFNQANVLFQANLQKDLKDADFDNEEDARKLQKFSAEVAGYQAEVNTQVQEYQQNLAGDIQVWQAERTTDLQKYNTDVQNEVNEFNKENVAYQSAIQESVQELQVANQVNLAKAQADLQLAMANEDRDQQRQLQNGVNDMKAIVDDNSRKIASWQGERQTDIQKYSADIQNELNEYNKENTSFQYEVQKAISDAQATNQVALQNGVREAQDAIENNNAQVSRFQSMAQHYSTQVNEDVQKYTVQVQALSADIAASVAEHGAELQGTQAEYLWLQDQYTKLKLEYDQAFAITAPTE